MTLQFLQKGCYVLFSPIRGQLEVIMKALFGFRWLEHERFIFVVSPFEQ